MSSDVFPRESTSPEATGAYQPPQPDHEEGERISTVAHHPVAPTFQPGRYAVLKFHAKGGMGEVWRALDNDIGREVALKRLREGRTDLHGRFLIEAQVTGQLEHPNIVPVHDIGVDDQGRPFYIMKFLHGRTLHDVVADYHAGGSDAATPEVQLVRLLQHFVLICQAVAYAHSRGVIHRDLKPRNIMIGQFGEVLILDWGLAKVLGQPDAPGHASYVHVHSSGTSSETHDGSALGTPSYMAPEMAEGRALEGDERTDVYLLGATLYEILTGLAPRRGASHSEMIELARTVSPVPPRQVKPNVSKPLEAVCLKAMAQRKQDRYPSAIALADDVQRYLAGEAVAAYPEGVAERVWRWCGKHRTRLMRTTAATLVLLLLLGGVLVVRNTAEGRRRAEQEAEALRLEKDARAVVAEFHNLADGARFTIASTNPEGENAPFFDPRAGEAQGRKALALLEPWGETLEQCPLPWDEKSQLKTEAAELLLRLVQSRSQPAPNGEIARALLSDLERARSLDRSTRGYHRLRAVCHRAIGDKVAAEEQERLAGDAQIHLTALDHFLLGEDHRMHSAFFADAGLRREALEKAVAEFRLALDEEPQDFWGHFQLGRCSLALNRPSDALSALSAAIAVRPDQPWGYSARGLALGLMPKHRSDGLRDLDKALSLKPDFQPARLNRGVVRMLQGRRDEAETDFSAVLAAPDDRRLVEAAYYRARLHCERGEYDRAREDLDRVVREKPNFRPVYLLRAQVLLVQGKANEALDNLDRGLAAERLPAEDDERHAQRGRLLRAAISELPAKDRTRTMWQLARKELQTAETKGTRSAALYNDLGGVLFMMGEFHDAIAAFSKGLKEEPEHVQMRINRGWAHEAVGEGGKAAADFTEAARLGPDNAEWDPLESTCRHASLSIL